MPSSLTILSKRIISDFNTRMRIRMIAGWPMDLVDLALHRRDPLVPPRGLWFIGGGRNFRQIDETTFACLKEAGLAAQDRVLDMGCGIGFMAARLTRYIETGSYEGFDVIKLAINWASSNITQRHPAFRFKHADVFSRHYNPKGKIQPQDFIFPYDRNSFDFVFGLSLFTHLLPAAAERYLSEMARTMKPGGRAWITAFLMNDESISCLTAGKSSYPMSPHGNCWVMDPAVPETAVGLMETDFRHWCDSAGLKIKRIDKGAWCGRSEYTAGHDHILLTR